jgi:hypothetical protein
MMFEVINEAPARTSSLTPHSFWGALRTRTWTRS